MKSIIRLFFAFFLLSNVAKAQNSFPIIQPPPNNITLPCGVNCTPVTLTVPHVKQTTDYLLQYIPFAPQPFVSPLATELTSLYSDDKFSAAFTLPFDVCFYDRLFTQVVVGSNGLVTFDVSNQATCSNAWDLRNNIPLPYAGGSPCGTTPEYYPRSSIMGAYADIDPSVTSGHPNRRIEYRVEGTAPYRRMVVSYNDNALFSCTSQSVTEQIIVYEGTGIVEVNIKDKPTCLTWNNGNAIIGIQNWERDKYVAEPGFNPGTRSLTDAAYRFLPTGGVSRFLRAELLLNNAVVGLGDTTTVTPGELQINFPSICPATVASQYVIRTVFGNCSGGPDLIRLDTVNITRSNTLNATYTSTQAVCASPTGSVTVNVPAGVGTMPITYSLNGGTPQTSNIFNGLAAGNYSIFIQDAGICSQTLPVTVTSVTGISGTATAAPTACIGVNNGTITVTPTTGVAPYSYSLNAGPSQLSNVFSGLAPGTYNLTFMDANGCLGTASATVLSGSGITSTSTQVNPPCAGINNGSLTITPTNGLAPYTYALGAGAPQASPTFGGLGPGTYTVTIRDGLGCSGTIQVTLVPTTPLGVTAVVQNVNCFGEANGSIALTANGGTTPYEFSNNGGTNYQASGSFPSLIAGNYNIRVRDFNGCLKDTPIVITQPTLLTASAASVAATCNGDDGTITLTAGGGTPNYEYSVDNGTTYQASNVFTDSIGTYNNILIKDSHGCIANTNAVVTLNDTMRLELGPDTTICEWSSVTFTPQTNPQTNIFTWSPNIDLSSTTVGNAVASPHYDVKYYLTAKWGVCQRNDSINVFVKFKPVPNAGMDTMICWKSPATLRGSVIRVSGPVSFLWSPADRLLDATSPITPAQPDTTQQYVLEVSDNYGCNFKVYDTVLITMLPPVAADAGRDTVAVEGVPHQLYGGGGVTYVWSPANVLDNPFSQNPQATLHSDTKFTVYVQNIAGCLGSDEVFIKVYKGPTYYVPNAFSPNRDGLNDVFTPIPVGIVKTNYFRVFNRYGELMFETKEYKKGWDGTYKGKKQDQGAYVWSISGLTRDGKTLEMKGTVVLIR